MENKLLPILLIFVISLTTCTTGLSKDILLYEENEKTYKADYNTVIRVTINAVTNVGLNIEDTYEEDVTTFVIIGKPRTEGFNEGDVFRTVVTDNGDGTITVRVLAENTTDEGDYTEKIFSSLDNSFPDSIVSASNNNDTQTETATNNSTSDPSVVRNRINDTEWIQSTLNELGYDCGVADGIMGQNTRSCIQSFQRENGLEVVTGSVNEATYHRIIDITEGSDSELAQENGNESNVEQTESNRSGDPEDAVSDEPQNDFEPQASPNYSSTSPTPNPYIGVVSGISGNGIPHYLGMFFGLKGGVGIDFSETAQFTADIQFNYFPKLLNVYRKRSTTDRFSKTLEFGEDITSVQIGINTGALVKKNDLFIKPSIGVFRNIQSFDNFGFRGFYQGDFKEKYFTMLFGLEIGAYLSDNDQSISLGFRQMKLVGNNESSLIIRGGFWSRMILSLNVNINLSDF